MRILRSTNIKHYQRQKAKLKSFSIEPLDHHVGFQLYIFQLIHDIVWQPLTVIYVSIFQSDIIIKRHFKNVLTIDFSLSFIPLLTSVIIICYCFYCRTIVWFIIIAVIQFLFFNIVYFSLVYIDIYIYFVFV